jgi:hypothetical protein
MGQAPSAPGQNVGRFSSSWRSRRTTSQKYALRAYPRPTSERRSLSGVHRAPAPFRARTKRQSVWRFSSNWRPHPPLSQICFARIPYSAPKRRLISSSHGETRPRSAPGQSAWRFSSNQRPRPPHTGRRRAIRPCASAGQSLDDFRGEDQRDGGCCRKARRRQVRHARGGPLRRAEWATEGERPKPGDDVSRGQLRP